MHATNFLKLLQTLSTKEQRQFRDYYHSPFFNKNEKVRALGDYILDFAPTFEGAGLSKKIIFPKLFGARTYDRLPINNVISDLQQLLLDFLAYLEYKERPQRQLAHQIRALLKREMTNLAEQRGRRLQQLQMQSKWRDYLFFEQEYWLYESLDDLFLTKQRRGYDKNLQRKNDALDHYFLANKFRIACDMVSRNVVIKANYECHFLEALLQYYESNQQDIQNIPTLKVYYSTLQMLQHGTQENYYFELKTLLAQHHALFPKLELTGIYSYLLNFCIKKINFGKRAFYHEIFELYKILLTRELIFKNDSITQWTFRNIVTAGIRTNELDWTEQFIFDYQMRLLPEERTNAISYNLATVFFAKEDYPAALQMLQDVAFTDNFYQIGAKTIQLKSYFELEETEAFFSLVSAFGKYLRRHTQLSDYHKELNLNFIKVSKKIFQWKLMEKRISRSLFEKKQLEIQSILDAMQAVSNKDWLEKQLKG